VQVSGRVKNGFGSIEKARPANKASRGEVSDTITQLGEKSEKQMIQVGTMSGAQMKT
jgi:hypothetical protein